MHPRLQPDLSLLFDLPATVAAGRIAGQARERDRFEQERLDFHERVRRAYLERARSAPQRITVIDADQSRETVARQLEEAVARICS